VISKSVLSFDVFGTLVDVRRGSYPVFESILSDCSRPDIDVRDFWERWETHNIARYWQPYRPYKDICALSLADTFRDFDVAANPQLIERYFAAFPSFTIFPDVAATLAKLSGRYRMAVVSNIDDALLAATPLPDVFSIICTAERAKGYKPDGTLFRFLVEKAGVPISDILHSGQSQFTDMVGGKPLGLTIAWINRRGVPLDPKVPAPDFTFPDIASLVPLLVSG